MMLALSQTPKRIQFPPALWTTLGTPGEKEKTIRATTNAHTCGRSSMCPTISINYAPRATRYTTKNTLSSTNALLPPANTHLQRRIDTPFLRNGSRNGSRTLRHRRAPVQTSGWKAFLLCCGLRKDVSAVAVWCPRRLVLRGRGVLEARPGAGVGVGEWGPHSLGRRREPRVLENVFWHRSFGCLVRHHGLEQLSHLDAQEVGWSAECVRVTSHMGSILSRHIDNAVG